MIGEKLSKIGAAVLLVLALAGAREGVAAGVDAITRPSADTTLSFTRPGRVAKILVKEGDTVTVGQVLMQQDDAAEQIEAEQLKVDAEDDTRVRAAEAQLAAKKVVVKRLEEGGMPPLQIDEAKLEVTMAGLSMQLAKLQREQSGRKYRESLVQLDRMRLLSPIGGKIEKLYVEAGESSDAQQKMVRVVQVDPLRIEAPIPIALAAKTRVGQAVYVTFGDKEAPVAAGKVARIGAVADPASDTRTVRIDVPNAAGRPAGEHVTVSFEKPADVAARGTGP